MLSKILLAVALVLGSSVAVLTGRPSTGDTTYWGPLRPLGDGAVQTFFTVGADGAPSQVGLAFSAGLLDGLPQRMNTTSRCFDKDGDGRIANHGECIGDYERDLDFPPEIRKYELPYKWATMNWNPEGHLEPAPPPWRAPHFDFHFYAADRATIRGIRPGPCGEFIDCADFARATVDLPAGHLPREYISVGAAVPGMGNHLIDSKAPEFGDPPAPFTATFIFGAYDGELIFWEPMVTRAFLAGRPNECRPIKQPAGYAESGYYPTAYCIRYQDSDEMFRVSLERYVYAEAGGTLY